MKQFREKKLKFMEENQRLKEVLEKDTSTYLFI